MSTTTASPSVLTSKNLEDWLLFLTPILGAAATLNFTGLIPGVGGFLTAVVIGSLAKTLVGLGQSPSLKNWEDWLSFLITFLGLLATGLTANAQFVLYGTILGFVAKSLPVFRQGFNIEDALLFVGSILALYGAYAGNTNIASLGLLIGVVGKSIPSLATGGLAGLAKSIAPVPMPASGA